MPTAVRRPGTKEQGLYSRPTSETPQHHTSQQIRRAVQPAPLPAFPNGSSAPRNSSVADLLYPAGSSTHASSSTLTASSSASSPASSSVTTAAGLSPPIPVTLLEPSLAPATALPITKYTQYHTNWAADPLALPHNAVRRQCADLYKILGALAAPRHAMLVSAGEIDQFFSWWGVFRDLVLRLLDVEEDVLYSRFRLTSLAGTSLAPRVRSDWKATLVTSLSSVDGGHSGLLRGDGLPKFRALVDSAISGLMAYFAEKETVLVPLISTNWLPRDARDCERELVRQLARGGGVADLQALVFWMKEMYPLLYGQWKQEYLPLSLIAQMAVGSPAWRRHQAIAAWLSGGSHSNPAEARGFSSVSGAFSSAAGSATRASSELRKKNYGLPRRHSAYNSRHRQSSANTVYGNFGEVVDRGHRADVLLNRMQGYGQPVKKY